MEEFIPAVFRVENRPKVQRIRSLGPLLLLALTLHGLAGSAVASPCVGCFVPSESPFELSFGPLPPIRLTADPEMGPWDFLSFRVDTYQGPGAEAFMWAGIRTDVWSTSSYQLGTSLFTGVPLITDLQLTLGHQEGVVSQRFMMPSNAMGPGGPIASYESFGGVVRLTGTAILKAMGGLVEIAVPLSHIGGAMGETTSFVFSGQTIRAVHAPFLTAAVVVTGISSKLVTIPARANQQGLVFTLQPTPGETVMTLSTNGGFVSVSGGLALSAHTVTISGTNNLVSQTLGPGGTVTVVSPMRISTGALAGAIPGAARMHMFFLPEPGMQWMLLCGAIGLAVMGRLRQRNTRL